MGIVTSIVLTVLLTLINGFFSMTEIALVSAKRAVLELEAEEGDVRAQRALTLISDSGKFLASIQVAITLISFASSAFAITGLSGPFALFLSSLGVFGSHVIAPVTITVAAAFFSIVIGELVPKRIALSNAERTAKAVAGFLIAFSTLFRPLVWLTATLANAVAKLLRVGDAEDRYNASEDEIKYMVTDAVDLSEEEKTMINEIFNLGDTVTREVMIPRVDMTAMEDTTTLAEALAIMRETGYSRIPVYHEDVDHVVGIAHIKDLIGPIVDKGAAQAPIRQYVREADFVPDTKDIIPLLSEMQTSHAQMVIVVDEYGGTAGVITVEDIVEEVVGEIEDEFDPDNKYLTKLSDRVWLVDGRFSLDDAIELGWPIEDSDEYETIAGFVLALADAVPEPGDVFEKQGYQFRVQSMRRRRLSLLRVTAPEVTGEDKHLGADHAGE